MTAPTIGSLPSNVTRAISKDEIASLPIGRYEGDICLVRTSDDVARAREDFRRERIVGFDTETRPSFHRGKSHPPSLIQAATANTVYLFRLRHDSDFEVPASLIGSLDTVKVGIGLSDDIRALKGLYALEERNMLDLGTVAKQCGLTQSGVRNLAGLFLNVRIPKSTKTSNWAAHELSPAQILYAATDAWICRELFLRFVDNGMIRLPDAPDSVL